MKRLSDYEGTEAIEIWADIFDPVTKIVTDEEVKKYTTGENADITKACKVIMRDFGKEIYSILNRIDDEPVNGANAFPKVSALLIELLTGEKTQTFFSSSDPERSGKEHSGSATASTQGGAK